MSRSTRKKIDVLIRARTQFAGVGTRQAKLVLNTLARGDEFARALRIALEIEDANLTAKRYFGGNVDGLTYADIAYARKSANIEVLIKIGESQGWTFGIRPSDVKHTTHIIYFDIPEVGQLSWHYSPKVSLPLYPGQWDGNSESMLSKLDVAVSAIFAPAEAA